MALTQLKLYYYVLMRNTKIKRLILRMYESHCKFVVVTIHVTDMALRTCVITLTNLRGGLRTDVIDW